MSSTKIKMATKSDSAELKRDYMMKRSQSKSTFLTIENYKSRWFVLDNENLKYYDGNLQVTKSAAICYEIIKLYWRKILKIDLLLRNNTHKRFYL